MLALVPGPGQVHRDPVGDGLAVAVAQPGQEGGVQAVLAGGPGGPDGCGGLAEGVAGLPGPDPGFRAGRVSVAGVPVHCGAVLARGQGGIRGVAARLPAQRRNLSPQRLDQRGLLRHHRQQLRDPGSQLRIRRLLRMRHPRTQP